MTKLIKLEGIKGDDEFNQTIIEKGQTLHTLELSYFPTIKAIKYLGRNYLVINKNEVFLISSQD